MNIYQPVISGSLTVTGSTTFFGNITINSGSLTMTSGSLSGTASLASNALLLQGTGSIGFATTASLSEVSSSQQQISSSLLQVSSSQQQISASLLNVVANYATTGSNSFRANQSITGSLVVSSTITAQTLVVQTVTSSIVYSSGSNLFGSALGDRQTFTGSVNITGSLALAGNISGNAITLTGALGGTSATFSGNLNLQGAVTRNINFYDSSNTNINAQIQYDQISSNSGQLFFGTNNAGTFATRLTISNTGAATFAAATQDAIQTVVRMSGNNASSQIKALDFKLTAGTPLWTISTAAVGTDAGINIMPNGSAGLSLAYSTGAATFTSTVDGTVFNSTSNAFRFSGNNAVSLVSLNSQNVVKINAAGYWGVQLVGANDQGILINNTGNVGIGTTSPNFRLQVRPTTDVNMIVTNNGSNLQIGSSNDAGNAAIPINFTATSFTFNNDVTFSTNISLGANQRIKTSGGAGNLTGSGQTSISSTIATIFSGFLLGGVQTGNLVIVNGVKTGTGWNFTDLVNYMTNGTITVISSSTVNTPPARTYTVSGNDLRLSIAGGDTGFVSCTALTQGYQA